MAEMIDRIKGRYQVEKGELRIEEDHDAHRFTQHLKLTKRAVGDMGDERQLAMDKVESSLSDRKLHYDEAIAKLHTLDRMLKKAANENDLGL
jgi:hypothetical protein